MDRTVLNTQRMMLIWLTSIGLHYLDPSWTMASVEGEWSTLIGPDSPDAVLSLVEILCSFLNLTMPI